MVNRIKSLLDEVEYTYLKIGTLIRESNQLRKDGRKGKAQSMAYTIKYLKRKMFNLRERFKLILRGHISFIKYQVQVNETDTILLKEAILVNVTNEEIYDILSIYCRFNSFKLIKILEIKRISTKLG